MMSFNPMHALIGGALIGLAAILMMGLNGRIAGVSGMVTRLIGTTPSKDILEPLAFVGGLVATPWLMALATGGLPAAPATFGLVTMAVAGVLVGAGAVLANGCTSGHGVCGIARFSRRSLVATAVFMTAAIVVVAVRRALGA